MERQVRSICIATNRDTVGRSSGLRPGVVVARSAVAVSGAMVGEVAMVTVTVDPGEVEDTGLAKVRARDRVRVTGRLPVTVPGSVLPPNGCFVTRTCSI